MKRKIISITLSEKDKRTIQQNNDICTEAHGKSCILKTEIKLNNKLN